MKRILGAIRRADDQFSLIRPNDRIAVGVSGGKDSVMLLYALSLYRQFKKTPFELTAITLGMGFQNEDADFMKDTLGALCRRIDVPYVFIASNIGRVVFEDRKEKHPCSLCARMRRGLLNDTAKAHGCNAVALGHHREDALETLLMSLIYEGRLNTFQPATYLTRSGVRVLRPMVFVHEKWIISQVKKLELPVVKSACPANGHTARHEMKALIAQLAKTYPQIKDRMLNALKDTAAYGLWDKSQ